VSGISTPQPPSTPSTTATQRDALHRVNNLTIAALASDEPITPVRLLGSMEQEELLDELAMEQNPGADDSEDEEADPEVGFSLASSMHAAVLDRAAHALEGHTALEDEFIVGLRLEFGLDDPVDIPGAPPGWKRPATPSDWSAPAPKTNLGEPPFKDLDNPGGWSKFVYRPKFKKEK
jgi:hypothetical protein